MKAGPVVAAAVVLAGPIAGLRDSKRLSAAARARLAVQIKAEALAWGIGQASVIEIDTLNVLGQPPWGSWLPSISTASGTHGRAATARRIASRLA